MIHMKKIIEKQKEKIKNCQKKAEMSWYMVMLVLALVFLVIMIFASSDIVKKFLKSVGIINEENDKGAQCQALFGTDSDNDGIKDTGTYTVGEDEMCCEGGTPPDCEVMEG